MCQSVRMDPVFQHWLEHPRDRGHFLQKLSQCSVSIRHSHEALIKPLKWKVKFNPVTYLEFIRDEDGDFFNTEKSKTEAYKATAQEVTTLDIWLSAPPSLSKHLSLFVFLRYTQVPLFLLNNISAGDMKPHCRSGRHLFTSSKKVQRADTRKFPPSCSVLMNNASQLCGGTGTGRFNSCGICAWQTTIGYVSSRYIGLLATQPFH
jgi:hypothetical protein